MDSLKIMHILNFNTCRQISLHFSQQWKIISFANSGHCYLFKKCPPFQTLSSLIEHSALISGDFPAYPEGIIQEFLSLIKISKCYSFLLDH